MRALIILATVLLVPIVMKFQARELLIRSNPETAAKVTRLLELNGVIDAQASVRYLEASILGSVGSESESLALEKKVKALQGVSFVENQLVVTGWFEFKKNEGSLVAKGVVPVAWKKEILNGQPEMEVYALKTRERLRLMGKNPVVWGLFIDRFFELEGGRELSLKGRNLVAKGEVLPSELKELVESSRSLGPEVDFESKMKEWPSRFHFKFRQLESEIEGEPLRSLARLLSEKQIAFQSETVEFSAGSEDFISALITALQGARSGVSFVLGVYPDEAGQELARRRAKRLKERLLSAGLDDSLIELVTFEPVGEEVIGLAELLIR